MDSPYLDDPPRKLDSLTPYPSQVDLAALRLAAEAKAARKRKARRVWRVLHGLTLIGLVVYFASRYASFRKHGTGCHGQNALAQVNQRIGQWDYDVPSRTQIVRCASADQWKPSDLADDPLDSFPPSEVSFDLPLNSAKLFLLSRGRNLGGKVSVETSEDQADDQATVKVKIYYQTEEALDWTKVCLLESVNNENENGIGIFTPMWGNGRDWNKRRLGYSVTVTLPTTPPGEDPLQIRSFETDLINTSQFFDSLDENVVFNSINLRGTNGFVRVEGLTALKDGTILTTNGKISGQINATDSLILSTTNAPVDVDVNFIDSNQANATLVIHTTNSPLKANIDLVSAKGSEGAFYVATSTTNGPLAVEFPKSPVDSILKLGASTTNSPASVILDAAYEGIFNLHTSRFFEPTLHVREDVDPAGKGRKKVTRSAGGRGEVTGVAQWGLEGQPELKGAVIVTTTNAPLSLEL